MRKKEKEGRSRGSWAVQEGKKMIGLKAKLYQTAPCWKYKWKKALSTIYLLYQVSLILVVKTDNLESFSFLGSIQDARACQTEE